ncbi:hypothetical protein [Uliginosibacterium aquaticum]|uniref:Uncharacterized protein n=1 Tax=Uliginosibacterium aquaticum TaxID=2731212 RepID=A0ABX2IE42_9RHOO|nr:hypothetical protein [Uliginosibacterium aquaticum]NSL54798.1 hypothetical protein [Uliginosibacterium aquaticum]
MSSAWGCPHDANGLCQRVQGAICSPGMRGCELEGKVRFANPELNALRKPQRAELGPAPDAPISPAKGRRRLPF